MNALRKLGLVVSAVVFLNASLLLVLFWTTNNTIAKREVVKSWITDSGVYDNVVDRIVEEVQKEVDNTTQTVTGGVSADLDVAVLQTAASSTFTPEVLRNAAETVLDGTYDWLEGTSTDIVFVIDLSEQKTILADKLAAEATNTLNSLPECTTVSELIENRNLSPFDATCRPPAGYEDQVAQFRDEFVNSTDFFPGPVINANDFTIETPTGTQTIAETMPELPRWYTIAKQMVWVSLALTIFSAIGIVFLSKTKRLGVKKLSGILLFSAVVLATIGFLTNKSPELLQIGQDTIQETVIRPLVQELTNDFAAYHYMFAGLYALLCFGGFVYIYLTRQKSADNIVDETIADKPELKLADPANETNELKPDNPNTQNNTDEKNQS